MTPLPRIITQASLRTSMRRRLNNGSIAATQINFAESAGLGYLMAQAVFGSLPVLIVYMFFQKYIVRAVSGAAT